jgi:16S rRNA (cytosine1402-N4)-methyltransferase
LEHFEAAERGFSFQADAPLDMRMDRSSKETAAAWLNRATHGEIAKALREFGGERFAGKIAAEIVSRRKQGRMKRTGDLVEAVLAAIPPKARDKRIHPATRTFQAVRIRVNGELEELEQAIIAISDKLKEGGRLAALSYHSGEDGCTKRAMKQLAESRKFQILTKKPIVPSDAERRDNPSSRSAKLRGIERIKEETE